MQSTRISDILTFDPDDLWGKYRPHEREWPRRQAGRELIRHAYETVMEEKYRFYSYGDCMLIV